MAFAFVSPRKLDISKPLDQNNKNIFYLWSIDFAPENLDTHTLSICLSVSLPSLNIYIYNKNPFSYEPFHTEAQV